MSRKASTKDVSEVPIVRPWNDLFGHDKILAEVSGLLRSDNWPQVVLFEGREGIGKRKLLAAVLGLIFCEEQRACSHCSSCLMLQNGFHPDVLWMESPGTLKVAEADKLQEHLVFRAQSRAGVQGWRVAVMVDIEGLTDQAANRLLKTLEEPPAQTRILLSCGRVSQLLPTIRSRLVSWHVQPPPMVDSLSWLARKVKDAGLQLEPKLLSEALQRSNLAPGRALQALIRDQNQAPESIRRLETLLLKPMDGAHLAEMQELLKQQGWKANELAQRLELLLNRYYKWSLGITSSQVSEIEIQRIRHWRKILQQVYRAGGSGHNHLNSQMIAEAWKI